MQKRSEIFWVTGVVAVSVRLVFYTLFSGTMFRFYHMVSGLDMQTLLRFSEWGEGFAFKPFFTLHRVMLFLLWKLNSQSHAVDAAFAIQSFFGVLGTLALTDSILMLCGKRKAALIGGLLYALYLPFLIYEFSILQESLSLNFLLFAFWSLLRARKKHFSFSASLLCGILWGVSFTGRPVALLSGAALLGWSVFYCYKKKVFRRSTVLLAGVLLVLTGATLFNHSFGWKSGPFYNVLPYTLAYNTTLADSASTAAEPPSRGKALLTTAKNMLLRTPLMLSVRELPENLNLYFWREKMPESRLLPGPEILISLTIFSLMIYLLSSSLKGRESLVLWMLLMAPMLCGREPIGRYRLLLCPFFIMIAVTGFTLLPRLKPVLRRNISLLLAGAVTIVSVVFELNRNYGLRSSDYHSWALATEAGLGNNEVTLDAFYEFWKLSRMRDDGAFRAFQGAAMRCSRMDLAAKVIRQAELAGEVSPHLIAYYTGLIYVGKQDPVNVMRCFSKIDPARLPADLQVHFFRIVRDSQAFLQKQQQSGLNKTR